MDENASQSKIKKAFRDKAMSNHPDQADEISNKEAKRRFIKLNRAYKKLIKESNGGNENKSEDYRKRSRNTPKKDGIAKSKTINSEKEWQEFKKDPEGFFEEMAGFAVQLFKFTFGVCIFTVPLSIILFIIFLPSAPGGILLQILPSIFFGVIFGLLLPAVSYIFGYQTSKAFCDPISALHVGHPVRDNWKYRSRIASFVLLFVYTVFTYIVVVSTYYS